MKKEKYIAGDVVELKNLDGRWKIDTTPIDEDDYYELTEVLYDSDLDMHEAYEFEISHVVEYAHKARLRYYKKSDQMVIEIYDREDGWGFAYGCPFSHSKEYDKIEEPEFIHIGLLREIVHLQELGYEISLNWRTDEDK